MRNYLACAALLVLACVSTPSHADAYYWLRYANGGLNEPTQYATPLAACKGSMSTDEWRAVAATSSTVFSCEVLRSDGWSTTTVEARRRGTECPPDTVYDNDTGQCIGSPECTGHNGIIYHQQKLADILPTGGYANFTPPPDQLCLNSCAYVSPAPEGDAYRFVNNDPSGAFQKYSYRGNEQACTADDTPEPITPPSTSPTSDRQSECTNKVTDSEGRVSYVCTVVDQYTEPGKMACGEVNGKFQCLPKTPAPGQVERTTRTETVERPNADGSKDTTTTTTTTTTTCSGVNACKTTTTTTVNNSHTQADGTPGPESSTCTGPGCDNPAEEETEEANEAPELEEAGTFGGAAKAFYDRIQSAPIVDAVRGVGLTGQGSCSMPSTTVHMLGTISLQSMCDDSHWLDPLRPIFLAIFGLAAIRVLMSA